MRKNTKKLKKGKGLNAKERRKKQREEKTKRYNATIKLLSGFKEYMNKKKSKEKKNKATVKIQSVFRGNKSRKENNYINMMKLYNKLPDDLQEKVKKTIIKDEIISLERREKINNTNKRSILNKISIIKDILNDILSYYDDNEELIYLLDELKKIENLELKNFSNINEINKIISNICDDLQKEINIIIENEEIRGDQNNIIDMLQEYEEELYEYII
jgi:predicted Zn-dependent peptidase